MKRFIYLWIVLFVGTHFATGQPVQQPQVLSPLLVKKCPDFAISGKGDNKEWDRTEWNYLTKLDSGAKLYSSKFKILYSATGVYVLLHADDEKITTKYEKDFEDLFKGDVFEVFFHTDPATPLYIEYEINQLNKELILLVPKINGRFHGWIPWHYEKNRLIKKMVNVVGGKQEANANISSWSAEVFFPYELFNPVANVPPVSGNRWNANFYRLDHDGEKKIRWAWNPVKTSFHETEYFRPIQFE